MPFGRTCLVCYEGFCLHSLSVMVRVVSVFVCLSSFGVQLRFCVHCRGDSACSVVVVELFVLCCRRHGIPELAEFCKCCWVGRRVGVGGFESVFMVCFVDVDRAFGPGNVQ